MNEVVRVGHAGLVGEIIKMEGEKATIQVFHNTCELVSNFRFFFTGVIFDFSKMDSL